MNKESNFFYVKGTDLDHFYKDLKAAEDNYVDDIGSTVLKLGKLNEIFAKKVLSYENIEYDSSDTCTDIIYKIRTGVINTKFRDNLSEKLKIIDYMNELRVERNFEIHADEDKLTSSEYIFKRNTSSKEMLMKMHEILKWYLIDLTKQISYMDEMKFEDPSKFNIHKNEIKKKEEEIYYIKRQIEDLNGLLKQSEQEKINNEADLEKMSRSVSRLELQKEELANRLKLYENELADIRAKADEEINRSRSTLNRIVNDYEKRIDTISSEKEAKIRELRDEYNNTNEKLKEKERYLIKSEEENLKLKNEIKKLKENNEDELSKKINEICAKEEAVDIQLNKLRKLYEECFNTTRKYQELLKESEKCIKRNENDKFVPQKKLIKAEIKVQDRDFDSSLNGYREKVEETKEKVEYVNEIINEKIFNSGEFKDFYKGFLEVDGDKLRLLYTMISKISMSSIIINKSKEIIFNSKEDELMDYIERKSESLKVLSDGEIRLKIYYRLLNLCGCSAEPVYDKRRFMSALDNVINTTYSMFESRGDFDSGEDKVKSINNYCMEKVINYFMKRNIDENKPEKANLIDNIYISFSKLPYDKKEEIRTKLKLDSISEPFLKREINVNPKGFVTTVLSSGGFISILLTDSFMTSISDVNNGLILNQGQKLQKQIIPLFIMQLSYLSRDLNLNKINLDNYEQMISVWRNKKSEFDNISMQVNIKDKVLNSLLKDKEENEDKLKKFKAVESSLYNTYGIKSDEFNKFVLDSEKKVHLPSYDSYSAAQDKNKEAMENIKNERQKLGLVKSIFSKEMWKNQSSRLVNDINISAIEKTLIKEATESEHFESEYSVIKKLKNDIDKTAAIINKIKSEIDDKEKRIREASLSIDELKKKSSDISREYPDII